MAFDRRTFFKGLILTTSAAFLAACSPRNSWEAGEGKPLFIPPLMEGEFEDSVRRFELTAQAGSKELIDGSTTPTWGFNGDFLGPTLRLYNGEDTAITVHNELDEMTTIHWHGMKIPARFDGGPHSPIEPGQSWEARWGINQPASTMWYHPHPHMKTALHCYRGLAGMIILDDVHSVALGLPQQYGVDDIPVVVTDHKFNSDGTFNEENDPDLGLMGDTPLVNGIHQADFAATTRRVRLRLLNGATMRFFNFALSTGQPFHVIATDNGFLQSPLEVESVLMGPGERAEIVIDLVPGETIQLVSDPVEDNFGIPTDGTDFGFQDSFVLMNLIGPTEESPAVPPLPEELIDDYELDIEGAPEREFELDTFEINGQLMDMDRIDFRITHDGPEVWKVTNANVDWPHNFHIHNARFQVINVENQNSDAMATYGWRDTVGIPPETTVTLAVEFGQYRDPEIPYMYHCHMLYHEDEGMMGQFTME